MFADSQLAEEVVLQHRIKEPYSMWKKMRRQGGGVDRVYDAVALRAVIKAKRLPGESDHALEERSKQLCYHVSLCFFVLFFPAPAYDIKESAGLTCCYHNQDKY